MYAPTDDGKAAEKTTDPVQNESLNVQESSHSRIPKSWNPHCPIHLQKTPLHLPSNLTSPDLLSLQLPGISTPFPHNRPNHQKPRKLKTSPKHQNFAKSHTIAKIRNLGQKLQTWAKTENLAKSSTWAKVSTFDITQLQDAKFGTGARNVGSGK